MNLLKKISLTLNRFGIPMNSNIAKAADFHAQGQSLHDKGMDLEAIEAYKAAIQCDPEKSESYYNIGLIYKYQLLWTESFEYNFTANKLNPSDESAIWNLAIAATALRNWSVARKCWIENGIKMDSGNDPIEMDFGITPVRLNPDDSGEVVWATRIDPVRARIESIPHIESGFNHGDVVLHDGAAVGYRKIGEIEYPVFNVLSMFEKSNNKTVVYEIICPEKSYFEALEKTCLNHGIEFENWTTNIRTLCRQCSEGVSHIQHDTDLKIASDEKYLVAFSSTSKTEIYRIIEAELSRANLTGKRINENT